MEHQQRASRLGGQIYDQLKRDILGLKLRPGDQLQEQELAAQYGASRTPTREALMRLVQEQLIVRSGRRYLLKLFSAAEIRNLYEIREALETMTVRLAVERATDTELKALARQADSLEPAIAKGNVIAFYELDQAFHLAIAGLARNPLLVREIHRLHELARVIFSQTDFEVDRTVAMQSTLIEHRRIAEAMGRRNALIAEEEMREKFRRLISLYAVSLGSSGDATDPQLARANDTEKCR